MNDESILTHIAGTFLIQAEGAFLNGDKADSGEDKNMSVIKSYWDVGQDGKRVRVPYVSAQSWRRWLRSTFQQENPNEPHTELKSLDTNAKENTNKIGTEMNPVNFAEDDVFGYMRAAKKQGKNKKIADEIEDLSEEEMEGVSDSQSKKVKTEKVEAVMRSSPFSSSILKSIRKDWSVVQYDEGFVHLKVGTPLPYKTEFYNTHLQGIFGLNYERLGIFRNGGDRVELDKPFVTKFLGEGKVCLVEGEKDVYEITENKRRERAAMILKALAVLRGGAKQAQFGTDVSPKAIIVAGMNCGNLIFNDLFAEVDGKPTIKIDALKETIDDYRNRIVTPIYIGIREGYLHLQNQAQLKQWIESGENTAEIRLSSPIKAIEALTEQLG